MPAETSLGLRRCECANGCEKCDFCGEYWLIENEKGERYRVMLANWPRRETPNPLYRVGDVAGTIDIRIQEPEGRAS